MITEIEIINILNKNKYRIQKAAKEIILKIKDNEESITKITADGTKGIERGCLKIINKGVDCIRIDKDIIIKELGAKKIESNEK